MSEVIPCHNYVRLITSLKRCSGLTSESGNTEQIIYDIIFLCQHEVRKTTNFNTFAEEEAFL